MNFRRQVLSVIAVTGILMGLTGSVVAETATNGTDANLEVTCNETISVDVAVSDNMELNISDFVATGYDSDVASQSLHVKMDLGCKFSNDFAVTAEIGTFRLNGTDPLYAFSGDRLVANAGTPGTYTGPTGGFLWFPIVGAPEVQSVMFPGGTSSGTAIEPETVLVPIIPGLPIFISYDQYSSGEMNGSWDMQLKNIPAWVYAQPGTYTAPLTVTFTVN